MTHPSDTGPSATPQPGDPDAFVDAGCALLGIPLDPAWRNGVAFNLRTIFGQAAILLAQPIPDETDPAPEFQA